MSRPEKPGSTIAPGFLDVPKQSDRIPGIRTFGKEAIISAGRRVTGPENTFKVNMHREVPSENSFCGVKPLGETFLEFKKKKFLRLLEGKKFCFYRNLLFDNIDFSVEKKDISFVKSRESRVAEKSGR